jgi:hypothetical protein
MIRLGFEPTIPVAMHTLDQNVTAISDTGLVGPK